MKNTVGLLTVKYSGFIKQKICQEHQNNKFAGLYPCIKYRYKKCSNQNLKKKTLNIQVHTRKLENIKKYKN